MYNMYSFDEITDAFGMQELTIIKWIDEGRFEGLQYINNTWFFNIDAIWTSHTGKRIPIKGIVESHLKLGLEKKEMINNNYINLIWDIIYNLENKYGGAYEETLMLKLDKTFQEKEDEQKWIYYLNKSSELDAVEDNHTT